MIYADPGSGALTWQLVIVFFFLGAIFFIGKLKGWLLSRTHRANELRATSQDHAREKQNSPPLGQSDSPACEDELRMAERSNTLWGKSK